MLRKIQASVRLGELPGPALVEGMLILVGAALLLTPGFLTDALGLTLLLPGTRTLYRNLLVRRLRQKIQRGEIHVEAKTYRPAPHDSNGDDKGMRSPFRLGE